MEYLRSIVKGLLIAAMVGTGCFLLGMEEFHPSASWNPEYELAAESSVVVLGNEQPILNGNDLPEPENSTFIGSVPLQTSTTAVYGIVNRGKETIALSPVYLSGSHTDFFNIDVQPKSVLNPGESTQFKISYAALKPGEQTVTVAFTSSDMQQTSFSFDIGALAMVAENPVKDEEKPISAPVRLKVKDTELVQADQKLSLVFNDTWTPNGRNAFVRERFRGPNADALDYIVDTEIDIQNQDPNKKALSFNGTSSYARGASLIPVHSAFTVMAWVKIDPDLQNQSCILSQGDFKIQVLNNRMVSVVYNNTDMLFNTVLDANRWYHIAVSYNPNSPTQKLSLFLNGLQTITANPNPNALGVNLVQNPFFLGKDSQSFNGFFNGQIDEVRILNRAISQESLRRLIYQELDFSGTQVFGRIDNTLIPEVQSQDFLALFSANQNEDSTLMDAISGQLLELNGGVTWVTETAPMPFRTQAEGELSESLTHNGAFGEDVYRYPWSVVEVAHDVYVLRNLKAESLIIEEDAQLRLINNSKLEIGVKLKLDGVLDLDGESQLIQTQNSQLDPASKGYLQRDQQGTTNRFSYNYWSSMVSKVNPNVNHMPFTVADILQDGTNPESPQPITWVSDITPEYTEPLTMSLYWIFKYQNLMAYYSNWGAIGVTGELLPGQGFTMKGSGAPGLTQNYIFAGKPNNGDISIPIARNNLNLTGNPYPSAIDAHKFIQDNQQSIVGALYFWEHYDSNQTHVTQEYQGGYAVRNLVGGTPPVAPEGISNMGQGFATPKRFIPVGQGFFVKGSNLGGEIQFNNSQRIFIRENSGNSHEMFRNQTQWEVGLDTAEDSFTEPPYKKVRLGYNFVNGFHRQILVGFMDDLATEGYDPNFDALNNDSNPDEMTFKLGSLRCVILGEGTFDPNRKLPLEIKSQTSGLVSFTLDGLEYFDVDQPVYIYDALTDTYHNIRMERFEFTISQGTTSDRFFLTFNNPQALSTNSQDLASIRIVYHKNTQSIGIKSTRLNEPVQSLELYNLLGQSVQMEVVNHGQDEINWPIAPVASGVYLLSVKTAKSLSVHKLQIP